jgi:hypothetical protein
MKMVYEQSKQIPVKFEADVVVAGGGPAGIAAALGAARSGAKTILVERGACLGGIMTTGVNSCLWRVDEKVLGEGSLQVEIVKRLRERKMIFEEVERNTPTHIFGSDMKTVYFDHEGFKLILDELMEESNVQMLYFCHVAGSYMDATTGLMKGVYVESGEGRFAIEAKVFIDATGMGELAWKAGVSCNTRDDRRHVTLGFNFRNVDVNNKELEKMLGSDPAIYLRQHHMEEAKKSGKLNFQAENIHFTKYGGPSGLVFVVAATHRWKSGRYAWDADVMTESMIETRKQSWSLLDFCKENLPGFENAEMDVVGQTFLIWGHPMIGEYRLKEEEMNAAKSFEDSVFVSNMTTDYWSVDDNGVVKTFFRFRLLPYDVPYRNLVSKDCGNLMACGKSADYELMPAHSLYYCVPSMSSGFAAGTAAALSAKNGVTPKELDVKLLQETLHKKDIITTNKQLPEEVFDWYREKNEWSSKQKNSFITPEDDLPDDK